MATRVELPKEMVQNALDQAIASRKRAIITQPNALIKGILEKELAELATARNTVTDTK